ncbi:hypothetical protein A1O3_00329 [Capronia epimyces CBS 606.96]|uniref:Uncharacterized protein n=1 Tax=Capronia epimyces CBS 606.96 TaxID=1182542 RepID=W9ZB64_9EURO|nr:uncharacterized protein A1O3_00329 [Capronia epimyces CBS 606.96]EXJ91779.1 hypothetical protein A1O3_00329 [Capronia epimyces CBS 606.96]
MSGTQPGRGRGRGWSDTVLPSHTRGRGRGQNAPAAPARGRGDSSARGEFRGGTGRGGEGRGGGYGGGIASAVNIFSHGPGDVAQPDLTVRKIENEIENNVRVERAKTSPITARLPPRPGFGTQGREVLLWTNYFQMVAYGGLVLHRYSLEILPDQAGRQPAGKKARRIVELLLEEHLGQDRPGIATDFKSNLISSTKLELGPGQGIYNVVYRTEDEDDPQPNAKRYRVRLALTASLTVSELLDELTSTRASALLGSKEEIIQALNIVVGHHPKAASHIASIGSNRHYGLNAAASDRATLGAGLAAIRGFFISVRAATG